MHVAVVAVPAAASAAAWLHIRQFKLVDPKNVKRALAQTGKFLRK